MFQSSRFFFDLLAVSIFSFHNKVKIFQSFGFFRFDCSIITFLSFLKDKLRILLSCGLFCFVLFCFFRFTRSITTFLSLKTSENPFIFSIVLDLLTNLIASSQINNYFLSPRSYRASIPRRPGLCWH